MNVRPAPFAKCVYTEGGVKCGARSLPVSKYCPKHILQDTHQVLFRPCGCKIGSDSECKEPLPDISEDAFCVYHTVLPTLPRTKVCLQFLIQSSIFFILFFKIMFVAIAGLNFLSLFHLLHCSLNLNVKVPQSPMKSPRNAIKKNR